MELFNVQALRVAEQASPMSFVFLLWHSPNLADGETDDKLIGVYSSEAEAEAGRFRTMQLVGFGSAPDGFQVSSYELNRDHWSEGYITADADGE